MPTTIPISAWSGKFSLFQHCCTSLTEISALKLLGLPARKRFFPNYDPSPTTAIPKLSIPMRMMRTNTATCERGSTESLFLLNVSALGLGFDWHEKSAEETRNYETRKRDNANTCTKP